jgi:hypothetical protein
MLYNQPYGVSDPDAAYVNGNPSTGTMGSIPPAASIEFPQREIVNVIKSTGTVVVPTNSDLQQLAKAIQSGQLNFKHDTGTANAYACNLLPDPGPYYEGLVVILKVLNANTGPSVLNLNSHGNAPIVRSDGSPLVGNDLIANTYVCFFFDGTSWRMVWSQGGATVAGMPVWLTAPRDFYVNGNTGNDAWDGTSATFVTGVKGPFKTLQRAANEYPKYNLNGYQLTIHVADFNYAATLNCNPPNGSGSIYWQGNPGSPVNCKVGGPQGSAITCSGFFTASMIFDGFYLTSVAARGSDPGFGIWAAQGAQVILQSMAWGNTLHAAIACSEAIMSINGPLSTGGSSDAFISCDGGRFVLNAYQPATLTFTGPVSFASAFEVAVDAGRIAGPWGQIFNAGYISGAKYYAQGNSVINTNGQGVAAIPGSVAGSVASGGQAF